MTVEEIKKQIESKMRIASSLRDDPTLHEFSMYHAGGFLYLSDLLRLISEEDNEVK